MRISSARLSQGGRCDRPHCGCLYAEILLSRAKLSDLQCWGGLIGGLVAWVSPRRFCDHMLFVHVGRPCMFHRINILAVMMEGSFSCPRSASATTFCFMSTGDQNNQCLPAINFLSGSLRPWYTLPAARPRMIFVFGFAMSQAMKSKSNREKTTVR